MIPTIASFLVISLVAMIFMCYSKALELQTGRGIVPSRPAWNDSVISWWERRVETYKRVDRFSIRLFFHNILVKLENMFLSLFVRLGKRFSRVGDMIRGKDLPKNRGSVSSFLLSIEHPRDIR